MAEQNETIESSEIPIAQVAVVEDTTKIEEPTKVVQATTTIVAPISTINATSVTKNPILKDAKILEKDFSGNRVKVSGLSIGTKYKIINHIFGNSIVFIAESETQIISVPTSPSMSIEVAK